MTILFLIQTAVPNIALLDEEINTSDGIILCHFVP